jgi:ZIP family zinc transporter
MEISSDTVVLAFLLTFAAGLSTAAGAAIGVYQRNPTPRFLSASLGLSAGVMLYVSLVEILPKSRSILEEVMSVSAAAWLATGAFFIGIALSGLIDRLLMPISQLHSAPERPAPAIPLQETNRQRTQVLLTDSARLKLMRTGLFTATAIAIHNFPEGLVTFVSTLQDPKLGFGIAVAVALHNIPEGIAVAVPIYHATGKRLKAFQLSLVSGLAEPLGAALGYFLFLQFFADLQLVVGCVFSLVGGVMVYICLDELLPTAQEHGYHHLALTGVFVGMAVMAVSLLMFL